MTTDYVAEAQRIVEDVVAPAAAQVDSGGEFPRAGINALAEGGLLGLLSSADVGGAGRGLGEAAAVVEAVAGACGSTAMVLLMHYSATGILEAHGDTETRQAIGAGRHLSTLAFSEAGSRSHFWAPTSTAATDGDKVSLNAQKSWVTAAGEADSYVWSSTPLSAGGPMTLWLVPGDSPGLTVKGPFDGLGLRGNSSSPITAEGVRVPASARLGEDGSGLDIALGTGLPVFLVLNAAFSLGLVQAMVGELGEHLKGTRLAHLDQTLAEQEHHRTSYARLLTRVDEVRAFLQDTLQALGSGRADATLRVLQVKAVAAEAASEVADGVMRLAGGTAFRKELGVERRFRDSLAARVMAPTTEALRDFVGKAALGLPLF